MKKPLLLALATLLLFVPSMCSAKWVYSNQTSQYDKFYYEDTRFDMGTSGKIRVFVTWCRMEPNDRPNLAFVSKMWFDIDGLRYKELSKTIYKDGKATTLPADEYWQDVIPGSVLETFMYNAISAFLEKKAPHT